MKWTEEGFGNLYNLVQTDAVLCSPPHAYQYIISDYRLGSVVTTSLCYLFTRKCPVTSLHRSSPRASRGRLGTPHRRSSLNADERRRLLDKSDARCVWGQSYFVVVSELPDCYLTNRKQRVRMLAACHLSRDYTAALAHREVACTDIR